MIHVIAFYIMTDKQLFLFDIALFQLLSFLSAADVIRRRWRNKLCLYRQAIEKMIAL